MYCGRPTTPVKVRLHEYRNRRERSKSREGLGNTRHLNLLVLNEQSQIRRTFSWLNNGTFSYRCLRIGSKSWPDSTRNILLDGVSWTIYVEKTYDAGLRVRTGLNLMPITKGVFLTRRFNQVFLVPGRSLREGVPEVIIRTSDTTNSTDPLSFKPEVMHRKWSTKGHTHHVRVGIVRSTTDEK